MECNHWETLPDDVWQHVMTMMPVSAVASCSQTSKFWRHLATDEQIWQTQCLEAGIEQPWPRNSWKQSLQAKAAWKHLEGQWDIHWNQKFNRKLLDISAVMSPSVSVKNSIHATISEPRFVHLEGSNETVFVFNMSHEQTKRVFTYVITPISPRDTSLPNTGAQPVHNGSLRDMFSVQVLRHEYNVWYNAYLLRSDSPAAAQYNAEELNKGYNHRQQHRPAFEIPAEVEMDEDSDSQLST
jgi:predicted metalloenzyme YecM